MPPSTSGPDQSNISSKITSWFCRGLNTKQPSSSGKNKNLMINKFKYAYLTTFLVSFLGPHLAVVRLYSWLCTHSWQGSHMAGLIYGRTHIWQGSHMAEPYGKLEIKAVLPVQGNIHTLFTVLLFWLPIRILDILICTIMMKQKRKTLERRFRRGT